VTIRHSETYRDYAIFVGELAPRTFEITIRNLSGDNLATDELRGRVDSNISLRYESLEEALDRHPRSATQSMRCSRSESRNRCWHWHRT